LKTNKNTARSVCNFIKLQRSFCVNIGDTLMELLVKDPTHEKLMNVTIKRSRHKTSEL